MFQQGGKMKFGKNRSSGAEAHKRLTHVSHHADSKTSLEYTQLPPPPPPPPQYHVSNAESSRVHPTSVEFSTNKSTIHVKSEHKAKSTKASYISPCAVFLSQKSNARDCTFSSNDSVSIDAHYRHLETSTKNSNKHKTKQPIVQPSNNLPGTNETCLSDNSTNRDYGRRNKLKDLSHTDPRHIPLLSRLLAPGFASAFSTNLSSSSSPVESNTKHSLYKLKPKNSLFRYSLKQNSKFGDGGKKLGSSATSTVTTNAVPKTCPVTRKASVKVKPNLERDKVVWDYGGASEKFNLSSPNSANAHDYSKKYKNDVSGLVYRIQDHHKQPHIQEVMAMMMMNDKKQSFVPDVVCPNDESDQISHQTPPLDVAQNGVVDEYASHNEQQRCMNNDDTKMVHRIPHCYVNEFNVLMDDQQQQQQRIPISNPMELNKNADYCYMDHSAHKGAMMCCPNSGLILNDGYSDQIDETGLANARGRSHIQAKDQCNNYVTGFEASNLLLGRSISCQTVDYGFGLRENDGRGSSKFLNLVNPNSPSNMIKCSEHYPTSGPMHIPNYGFWLSNSDPCFLPNDNLLYAPYCRYRPVPVPSVHPPPPPYHLPMPGVSGDEHGTSWIISPHHVPLIPHPPQLPSFPHHRRHPHQHLHHCPMPCLYSPIPFGGLQHGPNSNLKVSPTTSAVVSTTLTNWVSSPTLAYGGCCYPYAGGIVEHSSNTNNGGGGSSKSKICTLGSVAIPDFCLARNPIFFHSQLADELLATGVANAASPMMKESSGSSNHNKSSVGLTSLTLVTTSELTTLLCRNICSMSHLRSNVPYTAACTFLPSLHATLSTARSSDQSSNQPCLLSVAKPEAQFQMLSDSSASVQQHNVGHESGDIVSLTKENQQLKHQLSEAITRLQYVDDLEWHVHHLSALVESMILSQPRPVECDGAQQTHPYWSKTPQSNGFGPCHHSSAANLVRSSSNSEHRSNKPSVDAHQLFCPYHHHHYHHQQQQQRRQRHSTPPRVWHPTNLGSCPSLPARVITAAAPPPTTHYPMCHRAIWVPSPHWTGGHMATASRFNHAVGPIYPPHYYCSQQVPRFGLPALASSTRMMTQPDQHKTAANSLVNNYSSPNCSARGHVNPVPLWPRAVSLDRVSSNHNHVADKLDDDDEDSFLRHDEAVSNDDRSVQPFGHSRDNPYINIMLLEPPPPPNTSWWFDHSGRPLSSSSSCPSSPTRSPRRFKRHADGVRGHFRQQLVDDFTTVRSIIQTSVSHEANGLESNPNSHLQMVYPNTMDNLTQTLCFCSTSAIADVNPNHFSSRLGIGPLSTDPSSHFQTPVQLNQGVLEPSHLINPRTPQLMRRTPARSETMHRKRSSDRSEEVYRTVSSSTNLANYVYQKPVIPRLTRTGNFIRSNNNAKSVETVPCSPRLNKRSDLDHSGSYEGVSSSSSSHSAKCWPVSKHQQQQHQQQQSSIYTWTQPLDSTTQVTASKPNRKMSLHEHLICHRPSSSPFLNPHQQQSQTSSSPLLFVPKMPQHSIEFTSNGTAANYGHSSIYSHHSPLNMRRPHYPPAFGGQYLPISYSPPVFQRPSSLQVHFVSPHYSNDSQLRMHHHLFKECAPYNPSPIINSIVSPTLLRKQFYR